MVGQEGWSASVLSWPLVPRGRDRGTDRREALRWVGSRGRKVRRLRGRRGTLGEASCGSNIEHPTCNFEIYGSETPSRRLPHLFRCSMSRNVTSFQSLLVFSNFRPWIFGRSDVVLASCAGIHAHRWPSVEDRISFRGTAVCCAGVFNSSGSRARQ